MPDMLVISSVLLWLVVLTLLFVVFALARQVGVLHERLAPAGTRPGARSPLVGEALPPASLTDLQGRTHELGGIRARGVLVLFVSPTCPRCRVLAPKAADLARVQGLDLLLASEGGDEAAHRRYAAAQGIEAPYVLAPAFARLHEVSMLPFALVVDAQGVLRGRGRIDEMVELQGMLDGLARAGVQTFEPPPGG